MSTVLSYMPGQTATIVQQTFNSDGYRADGYSPYGSGDPVVARIIFPDSTVATGYPQPMNKLDVGLFNFSFKLPTGAAAVGTYIVDIYWYHPTTAQLQQDIVQIVVFAPFGLYGVTVPSVPH
jgi:peptidoglycan hydrolase-like protein with peptidoglycan-binding domain